MRLKREGGPGACGRADSVCEESQFKEIKKRQSFLKQPKDGISYRFIKNEKRSSDTRLKDLK